MSISIQNDILILDVSMDDAVRVDESHSVGELP
jgi:hypothetical protein